MKKGEVLMAADPYTRNPYPYASTSAVRAQGHPWWLLLLAGVAAIILGILFLVSPWITLLLSIQFLGYYWCVIGVLSLMRLFVDRSQWVWSLITGILGILAGLMVISHPLWSTFMVPENLAIVLGA